MSRLRRSLSAFDTQMDFPAFHLPDVPTARTDGALFEASENGRESPETCDLTAMSLSCVQTCLIVVQIFPRFLQSQELPEDDSIGINIGLSGAGMLIQDLWGHPPWKLCPMAVLWTALIPEDLGQAKVSNLATAPNSVRWDQWHHFAACKRASETASYGRGSELVSAEKQLRAACRSKANLASCKWLGSETASAVPQVQ